MSNDKELTYTTPVVHSKGNGFDESLRNSKTYASLPNRCNLFPFELDDNTLARTAKVSLANNKTERKHNKNINDNNNQQFSDHHSFGLSNNLSSESIKDACDIYDDEVSDDDIIEVQSIPQSFNRTGNINRPINFCIEKHRNQHDTTDEHLLCAVDMDTSTGIDSSGTLRNSDDAPDEALSILNELDAILDIHSSSQFNLSNLSSEDTRVEEYLMDLDNYLEEMENESSKTNMPAENVQLENGHFKRNSFSQTLPIKKRKSINSERLAEALTDEELDLVHRQNLRKTFSCTLKKKSNTDGSQRSVVVSDLLSKENTKAKSNECIPNKLGLNAETVVPANVNEIGNIYETNHTEAFSNPINILTEEHIFDNLLQNESTFSIDNRPRQFGRRSEAHSAVYQTISLGNGTIFSHHHHHQRPMSAPVQNTCSNQSVVEQTTRPSRASTICSEESSLHSSRIPSPISVVSSEDCSSSAASSVENTESNITIGNHRNLSTLPLDPEQIQIREKSGFNSEWPHGCSRFLALIGCTLGVFNISRFAVMTINYGGNFLLQFLLLSFLFGIPMFWLQMCLGNRIKAGPVSMWKISPIMSGIGIALVTVQCFLAIYSTVSVAWIFVYIRDTFWGKNRSFYRWQEMAYSYGYNIDNSTGNLTNTVADYFNIVVLQRLQLVKTPDSIAVRFHVNDRLAFYLVLIWTTVFLVLCKGLKSLGKMVFILYTVPLIALIVLTSKFLNVVDPSKLQNIFSATDFDDFFINSKTWTAATQETFFTWGLLGVSVISITSRSHCSSNKYCLRRDAILLTLVTLLGLSVTALLAVCCAQILKQNGFIYVPGSFENPDSYTSVYSLKAPIDAKLLSFPPKWVPHYSSFIGETYRRPNSITHEESGYQALRFISEIFPVVLSLTSESVSWIWAAVALSIFAFFGLAQLCVMWKPISTSLGNSTSSVLLSCVTGLLLSIPFAGNMGISLLFYVDFLLGGAWFIPILWTALIFGVFLIRGRPYNGDDLVNNLKMASSMSAFLALSWNVLLPIALVTLSIIEYKASLTNQFYSWRGKSYFSYWTRKAGSLVQIGLLLVVPVTAIIQIYRYLTNGPADILERIQLLYRPEDTDDSQSITNRNLANVNRRDRNISGPTLNTNHERTQNDAPPKYTPPPSYTTATGARLAKILRQSIRRSVRRVLGESSNRTRPTLPIENESNEMATPPGYLTVLNNDSSFNDTRQCNETEIGQRLTSNPNAQRSLRSMRYKTFSPKNQRKEEGMCETRPASAGLTSTQRPYTAEDVVTILRSSVRNRDLRGIGHQTLRPHTENTFRSIENLVFNAEPPDQTPGVSAIESNAELNHHL